MVVFSRLKALFSVKKLTENWQYLPIVVISMSALKNALFSSFLESYLFDKLSLYLGARFDSEAQRGCSKL